MNKLQLTGVALKHPSGVTYFLGYGAVNCHPLSLVSMLPHHLEHLQCPDIKTKARVRFFSSYLEQLRIGCNICAKHHGLL